ENNGFAVAMVNCTRPIDIHGEVQTVQLHFAVNTVLDMPGPASFAFPCGGRRIEVTRATPVTVASNKNLSGEFPLRRHAGYLFTCRAMNAFTISRARSVCGPGVATHSCSQPSNSRYSMSPPADL